MAITALDWILGGGAVVMAAVVTGFARQYALRKNVLDHAEDRSMHTVPTPRGGGIGIAVAITLACLGLGLAGLLEAKLALAIGLGGAVMAAVGYWDDHVNVSSRIRLAIQFGLCAGAMGMIMARPETFGGWLVAAVTLVAMVWCVNLYNFMDGIDGLSGSQAVFVAGAATWLGLVPASLGLVIAGAGVGFLVWNWPPAKIFMGDVGSAYLGYVFAVLAVHSMGVAFESAALWFILLAVFVVDATLTLLVRASRRERLSQPHRTHAFQRLATRLGKHAPVTLGVIAINVLLLAPLAWLAATAQIPIWIAVAVAGGTLAIVAWVAGAGRPASVN